MQLKAQGIIRAIGASNVSAENLKDYLQCGALDAIQEKYSMLDRGLEQRLVPNCLQSAVSILAYSPLEQGLLTGKIGMDYQVDEKEARNTIPWMKPQNRQKVLTMLKGWEPFTQKYNCQLSHLVVAWTLAQKGISHILCGARKSYHITETALAAGLRLTAADLQKITADIHNLEKQA